MSVLSLMLMIGLSVCPAQSDDAAYKLSNLMEEYYNWYLGENPESATFYGVNTWNHKRDSYNLTVYPRKKATADGFYYRLTMDIRRADLSKNDQLNYDILKDTLSTYIDGYTWFKYGALNPINFLEGEPSDFGNMARTFPLKTARDFEDYLGRLDGTKTQLAEMEELFREAIRLGRTLNAVSINRVPGLIEKILVEDVTQSVFYAPFNDTLDSLTDITFSRKQSLRGMAEATIRVNVLIPYRNFKTFLESEYMLHTRSGWGVDSWDDGQAYYRACLKWHLSQDVTAMEIHQKGLDEVKRISTQMINLMSRRGFSGTISEYYAYLKTIPEFGFSSADDILQGYRDIIFQRINPELSKYFRNLPDMPIEVRGMPNDGPGGYYSQGSEDGIRAGIFWANVIRPNETYSFTMMALSAHEANPGHHLQVSKSLKISVPPFRKYTPYVMYSVPFAIPAHTAYVEGWALYAEALAEEMGLYKDDFELMGRYSDEIFRACRMVVDTGLHAFGWSKDQAVEYMLRYTSVSRAEIEIEIDRYVTWPGQACAYKFGELKIWELRRKAELLMGEGFDIKDFHATILNLGSVPLHTVDKAVDDMIDRVRPSDTVTVQSSQWTLLLAILVLVVRQVVHG